MDETLEKFIRSKNENNPVLIEPQDVWQLVGIVDSYGAVHFVEVSNDEDPPYHQKLWPTSQKRWRFYIRNWELDKSVLSKENLTDEDCEAIQTAIRRKFTPPRWYLWGEFWDANGRPYDEKTRNKLLKQFEKKHGKGPKGEFLC